MNSKSGPIIQASIVGVPNAPSSIPDYEGLPTKELCTRIQRPKNPLEIISNIKFLLEHDLLFREDCYSEKTLLNIFGGEEITKRQLRIGSTDLAVWISNFSQMAAEQFNDNYQGEGIDISIDTSVTGDLIEEGWIRFLTNSVKYKCLVCENLIKTLGKPDSIGYNRRKTTPHGGRTQAPQITHPNGGKELTYLQKTKSHDIVILCELHGDGTLATGSFKARRAY